jgi:hypothetical protein
MQRVSKQAANVMKIRVGISGRFCVFVALTCIFTFIWAVDNFAVRVVHAHYPDSITASHAFARARDDNYITARQRNLSPQRSAGQQDRPIAFLHSR